MATRYNVIVRNRAGAKQWEAADFLFLGYRIEVNAPGWFVFEVRDNHPVLDYLEYDGQIEIWREDVGNGISAYADKFGLYVDQEPYQDDNGIDYVRIHGFGQMDYLRRSIIAYAAGTDGRSEFTSDPAETIMKNLVTYNATSSGTTGDGRDRNVPTWGGFMSVEADGAGGNTLDRWCARKILLNELQDVARIGGGDFNLVKTAAQAWQFRWYAGQLGTDRSATVIFSPGNANMRRPRLVPTRLTEKTVAIVAGQGEEADRTIEVRTGTNYDATFNSREFFVPAVQYSTSAGLQGEGDAKLDEVEARDTLEFEVLQTQNTLYGREYFLGDLVTGRYRDVDATKQVGWVQVTVSAEEEGIERVEVGLEDA